MADDQTSRVQATLDFEEVKTNHGEYAYRAKVPGGWIYKFTCVNQFYYDGDVRDFATISTCFVPDGITDHE